MSTINAHTSSVRFVALNTSSAHKRAQIVCRADKRDAGSRLGAAASAAQPLNCYNDLGVADAFNSCYLNYDELSGDQIVECVSVAKKVVKEAESADICNEEVCTKTEHADWFARYFSNEFGLE